MILHPAPDATIGEARLRVRYAETDKMGVVYNSNYLIWFEIGRVELMRELGHSYHEIEEDGYLLPVTEVTCRFKGSAAFDDQIVIHTSILKLRLSHRVRIPSISRIRQQTIGDRSVRSLRCRSRQAAQTAIGQIHGAVCPRHGRPP